MKITKPTKKEISDAYNRMKEIQKEIKEQHENLK